MQLPAHGPIACRRCWPQGLKNNEFTTADRRFRVVNDPGAWGSPNPEVLVLGISKGFTQANAYARGDFDGVPFKDCRPRLKDILVTVGVLNPDSPIDQLMQSTERHFAWGSVVRCSLSGWNEKKRAYCAGTPEVLPAFKHPEARLFLHGCTNRFLKYLPERIRIVVLLGNDDRYIETMSAQLQPLYGKAYRRVNPVAHATEHVLWVHVAHPSRGNGHFGKFLHGSPDSKQGRKREFARDALEHWDAETKTDRVASESWSIVSQSTASSFHRRGG